jgi:glycosyltransferase involved in cell wall biosynthesis
MLSVIIPTLNAEAGLARTLAALVPAAAEGVVREVVVGDGGSRDGTEVVADAAGCGYVNAPGPWGGQVASAIAQSRRMPWLMILPPDVILEGDWFREVASFIERSERAGSSESRVGVFTLEFEGFGLPVRLRERALRLRARWLGRPVAAQGIVLSRALWDRVSSTGAPASYPALIAAIGRRRVHHFRASALSAGT